MNRLSTALLALIAAAGFGLSNAGAQNQEIAPPTDFGSPPAGAYPILYNDHHVYAAPDAFKQGRVLAALVRGGTLLIPLRSLLEQMGATVSWDAETKTVTVLKPGAEVRVTVGGPTVVINGESRPLDVPPVIYEGAVLVPLRVILEGMGAYVQWIPARRIVVVRYVPATPPPSAPPPPPPPPPTPTTGPPIQRSLTAMYNSINPERCQSCSQFGRYTYVLLTDKSDRSLALLTAVINGGSANAAPLIQSTIAELGMSTEYKSVNLFLLPALSHVNVATASSPQPALNDYDVNAAGTLRQRYCVQRSNSICGSPFDRGPILLIFLRPASEMEYGGVLRYGLAVDMTGVPEAQFPHVIDVVEKAMDVPQGYAWGDRTLPLSPTDTVVASFMSSLQSTLMEIPGAKAFLDLSHVGK